MAKKKTLKNARFARPGEQAKWQQLVKDLLANTKSTEIIDKINRVELSLSVTPTTTEFTKIITKELAKFSTLKTELQTLSDKLSSLLSSDQASHLEVSALQSKVQDVQKEILREVKLFTAKDSKSKATEAATQKTTPEAVDSGLANLGDAVRKLQASVETAVETLSENTESKSPDPLSEDLGRVLPEIEGFTRKTAPSMVTAARQLRIDLLAKADFGEKLAEKAYSKLLSASYSARREARSYQEANSDVLSEKFTSIADLVNSTDSPEVDLSGIKNDLENYLQALNGKNYDKSAELFSKLEKLEDYNLSRDTGLSGLESTAAELVKSRLSLTSRQKELTASNGQDTEEFASIASRLEVLDASIEENTAQRDALKEEQSKNDKASNVLRARLTALSSNIDEVNDRLAKAAAEVSEAKRAKLSGVKRVAETAYGKSVDVLSNFGVGAANLGNALRLARGVAGVAGKGISVVSKAKEKYDERKDLQKFLLGERRKDQALLAKKISGLNPTKDSEATDQQQAAEEDGDRSLLKRQVLALEKILKGSKSKDSGSSGGLSGLVSGLLGALGLKGILGKGAGLITSLVRSLAGGAAGVLRFLPTMLLRLANPIGLASVAMGFAWKGAYDWYEANAVEIQNGIESVVNFGKSVADKAKAMWESAKSRVVSGYEKAKEFVANAPSAIVSKSSELRDQAVAKTVELAESGVVVAKAGAEKIKSAAAEIPAVVSSSAAVTLGKQAYTSARDSDVGQKVISGATSVMEAGKQVYDTVSGKYKSMSEAAGKLFRVGPGVDVDNLNPSVSSNFANMAAEYKELGGKGSIQVNSGYRSYAKQAEEHRKDPRKAAPPGKSAHEKGLAIDINSREANELDSMGLLAKYGFSRPVPGEAWHLQAKGTSTALAAAGVYSADSMASQPSPSPSVSSTGSSSEKAPPVLGSTGNTSPRPNALGAEKDFVPSSTGSGSQSNSRGPATPPSIGTTSSASSASTVPTFSFVDSGMFIMNSGMFAS